MRRAQVHARGQHFSLDLPPLENMHAVQSALSQVIEALAADMIDPKRAHQLLIGLRQAATNFRHPEAWRASEYLNDQSAAYPTSYEEFEAEYGLPEGIDLNVPPEVAFPPPAPAASETDNWSPATDNCFSSPMPTVAYCKDGPGCPEHTIRADFPVTPENVEVYEVLQTEGSDAAARRGNQLSRNRQRRLQTSNRKRYAAIALERNLRLAAEKLAQQKLAAQTQAMTMPKKSPASAPDAFETDQTEAQKTA
jgi:hypothetical protein